VGELFAHSDEHCAPFITAIELAVGVDPGTLSKNPLRLDFTVQPNPVDCGFHVVLNARSLTKYMLDRNEGAPVANLKDDRQPPPPALPEVRQYRKQLVQHITALPHSVSVPVLALTPSAASANRQRAYVHNNRNNPIKKNTTDSGSLCFFPEKLGQCFFSLPWWGGCLISRWGLGGRGSVGPVRGSERRVFASVGERSNGTCWTQLGGTWWALPWAVGRSTTGSRAGAEKRD
jgi:hypothetical protein